MNSNQTNSLLLVLAAVSTLSISAISAEVQLTITGSTAFRSITIDRAAAIMDPGYTGITNDASAGKMTFIGTVSNAAPVLGNTPVKLRLSFSGSISGMNAVNNQTPVNTAEGPGTTLNVVPDVALSDVFPAAATPPIPDSAFTRYVVGVLPFAYVRNNNVTGLDNLTQDQAVFLMANSGPSLPQTFFGGANPAPLYLIGRDAGSGSRLSIERDVKFVGSPVLWATNAAGKYILTNGFSSGSLVRNFIRDNLNTIGYLGLGDYLAITNQTALVAYNGVRFTLDDVYNGRYTLWGYEHMVHRVGGLSGSQQQVFNALKNAIIDPAYQETSALYAPNFGELTKMRVERNSDGGPLSSLEF